MEKKKCLGLYISNNCATAVLLSLTDHNPDLVDCFKVKSEHDQPRENENQQSGLSLGSLIARKIAEKEIKYDEAMVAIDCSMFTQHNLHSEFTEYKQIENTIRFDAEDALAEDATTLAVAFNITDKNENGSDVSVFTAKRWEMTDLLNDLQASSIDPVFMEPDIVCLARFLENSFDEQKEENALYIILSDKACYLICPPKSENAPKVRSFLLGSSRDITSVMLREIPLTIASYNSNKPIDSIIIAGEIDNVDVDKLKERTGYKIQSKNLSQLININESMTANLSNYNDFAIAYGACLAGLKKIKPVDFRQDFLPYQGKKMIMQRALRLLSISLTVLMLSIGISGQIKAIKYNNYTKSFEEKSKADFIDAMRGKDPGSKLSITEQLKRELRRVKRIAAGQTADENSVPGKLTSTLEAINEAYKNTPQYTTIDLNIQTLTITSKTTKIVGDTKNRPSTLKLFKSINQHPNLKISTQTLKPAAGRDSFIITIDPKSN